MKLFGNPLLLHHYLGHHVWLGCTWNVAAVENPQGSASGTVLEGDGMSTGDMSSSSEVLKENWHHTGLWHDWLIPMLYGVLGSQEMSSLDTWWILGVHLREMGMLKFSLPIS